MRRRTLAKEDSFAFHNACTVPITSAKEATQRSKDKNKQIEWRILVPCD